MSQEIEIAVLLTERGTRIRVKDPVDIAAEKLTKVHDGFVQFIQTDGSIVLVRATQIVLIYPDKFTLDREKKSAWTTNLSFSTAEQPDTPEPPYSMDFSSTGQVNIHE